MHGGHALGREHLGRAVAAIVELSDEIVGQVLCGRDEIARGQVGAVEPFLARHRPAQHAAVTLGKIGRQGGIGHGSGHAQRIEHVLGQVGLIGLPGYGLNDHPEDVIVVVEILVALSRGGDGPGLAEGANAFLDRGVGARIPAGVSLLTQAAGLMQELSDGDLGSRVGIGQGEPGEVGLHGRTEIDGALLRELHDGQRGERLGDRRDIELGVGGHGLTGASLPIAAEKQRLVTLHDTHDQAGQPVGAHLGLEVGVQAAG